MDCENVVKNIRNEFKKYYTKHNLKSAILGISGGIDSCVIAALVKPACEELGVKLIGRSLTILTNKNDEISRANKVGKTLCHDFKEVDLAEPYKAMAYFIDDSEGELKDDVKNKIRLGNIKARCRMIYLYNLAYSNSGLVLSTDNLSELLLSFFTIHGDHCDFGLMQYLWKREVYELAEYLITVANNKEEQEAIRECIDAIPTDGLGITNSDLDQIQASTYLEVDTILEDYVYNGNQTYKDHPVIKRYEASHFKRNWPVIVPRETLFNKGN